MRKLFIIVFVFGFCSSIQAQKYTKEALDSMYTIVQSTQLKLAKPKHIKIMAVGDIMMGTDFPNKSYLPPKGKGPFDDVNSILSQADILFGNLEGTLTDEGKNAKNCSDPSKCYSFRSPEYFGEYLEKAGFDVMSIANNHIGDFGAIGIKNTSKTLEKHNIAYAGIFAQPSTIFEKNGITYGFCAFAPNKDCLKIHNLTNAKKIVTELKQKVDIVIVSFHGGAEGLKHTHVPRKTERFYGEDRGDVYRFAHTMIDAGADIVLGHGPHVSRAFEIYKDKFIAYSLGNFCTYSRFSLGGIKGYAPIAEIEIDTDGNFKKGKLHSAKQIDEIYPFMDDKKGALKAIKALTEKDFPESKLIFEEDGSFTQQK
ncbi:CapA family protein [Aquimarina muelleri]|uniref:Metallophosphatase n=1 Tax=Aquimarina muelleri TaxID=279356 RepID=A0A918JVQ8_9FLAO|nr:CapA family protein [Aquimarina muelleri]MCX2762582.1 CapA family protein [Aquimarina muelleri]GGX24039.1 metallophosphatase [Aquimarina muelleri]